MQWHARLRNLAFRAHPDLAAVGADPEHDATLIRRFSEGLNSLEAAQFLTLHEAPDYTAALNTAIRHLTSQVIKKAAEKGRSALSLIHI